MKPPIRVLHLEDDPLDAALIRDRLTGEGFHCNIVVVDGKDSFASALSEGSFDLILCDHNLPDFDALAALRLAQERCPDIPTIVITGTMSDEEAVKCLKAGAADYVLKDRVSRLGYAVTRALEEAEERRLREIAEAALRDSEERFHLLMEFAPDALLVVDQAGRIQMVNTEAERLFGYRRADLLGQPVEKLMPARYREGHARQVDEYHRSPQVRRMGIGLELVGLRRDGSEFPVEVSLGPYKAADKHMAISAVRDVTDRTRLEERSQQAQKLEAIGRLAAGVAHDFNNLLTVINGTAELALRELREGDPMRRDLQEICRAGESAAALTRQLLVFGRKQILQPQVVNLNTVVVEMESMLRRLIGEDIDITILPAQSLGSIKADPGQMEQVIVNLAVNARDAMPEGGKLTIETQNVEIDGPYARQHGVAAEPGPYVMLAMSDTGAGMDEVTRARIFEPFFTTKSPDKGTGLGLSTVYGIVRQSGGLIWAYSEVGKGTSFKIYLPQVVEVAGGKQRDRIEAVGRGVETILIVEDVEGLRNLATRILESAGYKVLTAASGEEALRLLRHDTEPVHLMVTDVVMPGMSGQTLATRFDRTRPGMKVLYMSGYTDDAVVRHGVLEQGVSFLSKPFTAKDLTQRVREVLDSGD